MASRKSILVVICGLVLFLVGANLPSGAGPDHPFLAQVPESRYLKAVFCRVLD